jgi:hypothetical protein
MFKNLKNRPSRVNPERLTDEALRAAAKKIKWNEEFYREFFVRHQFTSKPLPFEVNMEKCKWRKR